MNYIKKFSIPFQGKRDNNMVTVAIIGGVAVGAAIAALFATEKGRALKSNIIERSRGIFQKQKTKKTSNKLGDVVDDVREHIRQTAEGLLGPESKRHDASEINVKSSSTRAWKNGKEKVIYPENKLSVN